MDSHWAIVEFTPSEKGDHEKILLIRESRDDCEEILKVIEKSNYFFDTYTIKRIKNENIKIH